MDNKKYFQVLLSLILFTVSGSISAQSNFYDSVKITVSSPLYDYKNPTFENRAGDMTQTAWLAYERHSTNTSDIIIRSSDYNGHGPEIKINNTANGLNINPTFDDNLLIWQSNSRGSWDLFYSIYSGSNWSAPIPLDTASSSDEINAFVVNNNTIPVQFNFYYVVYEKNHVIWLKVYSVSTNSWIQTIPVTTTPGEYGNPIITRGPNASQYIITYLEKLPNNVMKIMGKKFHHNTGDVAWLEGYQSSQSGTQLNLNRIITDFDFLTYDYDTLGSTHSMGIRAGAETNREVFTKSVPGKHSSGKAALMGFITDNSFSYYFSVFSCITKIQDSTRLTFLYRPSSSISSPLYKKIYVGDSATVLKYDLSSPIFLANLYKIKAVWEQKHNGKIALFESSMKDGINNITPTSEIALDYSLQQNFPNPFNPETKIKFSLPKSENASLKIYDLLGNEISTLSDGFHNAGTYEVNFKALNLSSGVYFYKLVTEGRTLTRKMHLIK